MTQTNKLYDLIDQFKEVGVFEDRREYTVEDLQSSEHLTRREAKDLHWLIQNEFEPALPELKDIPAEVIKEFVMEAEHGNFDGWDSEHDRIVLARFLRDMRHYAAYTPKNTT